MRKQFEKALTALDEIEKQRGLSEEVVRTKYEVLSAMGRQEEGIQELERFNKDFSSPAVLSVAGDHC